MRCVENPAENQVAVKLFQHMYQQHIPGRIHVKTVHIRL